MYKGSKVGEGFIDLLIEGRLVVELKAVETLTPAHRSQVIFYLAARNLQLGFLVNLSAAMLKDGFKRIVNTKAS